MPIQRELVPDLEKPEICDFLKDPASTIYETEIEDAKTHWQASGYVMPNNSSRLLADADTKLPMLTFAGTPFEIRTSDGRLFRSPVIWDPVEHDLMFHVVALLFVSPRLDPGVVDQIVEAFNMTDPFGSDLGAAETAIISLGVNIDDYQIVLCFTLERRNPPDCQFINRDAFADQVRNAVDENGDLLYDLRLVDAPLQQECHRPNLDNGDPLKGDPDDAELPIKEHEKKKHPECEDLEVTAHRIGTAFQYYEWKVEWLVRPIRVGRCTICHTRIPVIFSRITKQALWGYATSDAAMKRYMESSIRDCIIFAAVSTAVLIIVTEGVGFAAAALAFSNACLVCLETKVESGVRCMHVDLKIVAETSEWQEKVF